MSSTVLKNQGNANPNERISQQMSEEGPLVPLTVVLLGNYSGKSSLVVKLINNRFNDAWDPTIEDSYKYKLGNIDLTILDTGPIDYLDFTPQWLKGSHAALVTFSVCERSQFEEIGQYIDVVEHYERKVPFVLVATKVDCEDRREVSREEAQALADQHGVPYIETSSKTGQGVREAFEEAIRQAFTTNENGVFGAAPIAQRKRCLIQ